MEADIKQTESVSNDAFNQFSFFRAYYESIEQSGITDAEKGILYSSVMRYAFDGMETELSGFCRSLFILIKPYIDKSKVRQCSGRNGGSKESKAKAKNKQTKSNNIHISYFYEKGSAEGKGFTADQVSIAESIISNYPRCNAPREAHEEIVKAVNRQIDNGKTVDEALAYLLDRVKRYAEIRNEINADKRFCPDLAKWLSGGRYLASEDSWRIGGADEKSCGGTKEKTMDEIFEEL